MAERQKILIVDDKSANLFSLRQVLKNLDVEVIEAKSGNEALIASLNHDLTLAILDVQMPEMDGYELAQLLRDDDKTKNLPIIFVSAVYSSDHHVFRGYDAGAVDFLVKPYNPAFLRSKVRVFLQLDRQRQQLTDLNATLEAKVRERTEKLRETVIELEEEIERRKETENKLQKAKREWQEIFEAIGHLTLILDKDFRIIAANRAALRQTGLSVEELIGRRCQEIFHEEGRPPKRCPVKIMLQTKELKVVEEEVEALGRDYIVSCTPVYNDDGELDKIIHIATDITERKKLARELDHAHKFEAIGTLAGGIAHDFNNILSAVLGFADLSLKEVEAGSPMEEDLKEIYTAGLRARDLVRQILNFARKTDDEPSPVRIDLVAKEVAKFLRSSIPTTIEIKQRISTTALVMANPIKVHQLLMNLCTNAAHAMDDKGTLTIELREVLLAKKDLPRFSKMQPGPYLRLQVIDTGKGIDPAIMDFIFEPFFTTKKVHEGTGMGLAMVHSIVKEMAGDITVKSELGKGSTFTVLLPVTDGDTRGKQSHAEELPTGTERILLIDDEDAICRLASRMLTEAGYSVTCRNDSGGALTYFAENRENYQLVITDMTMPKLSGDMLTRELLELRGDLPIIIATGFHKSMTGEHARKLGARALLLKPFEKSVLLRTVRRVLDGADGDT